MKKIIVTTTIYEPSTALLKYSTFKDWDMIIVGDKKTPHNSYFELERKNKNIIYLSPEIQEKKYKKISDAIGWNKIQRRSIGFIEAYLNGADIVATVDDDNIPYDNWGKNIYIGKETLVHYYETNNIAFDPIAVTNYPKLWHRGYPIQDVSNRNSYKIKIKKIIPDIQANFWNGDPDIDAVCRLEHAPMCFFDKKYFPIASNAFSPFNHQNTIISRKVLKYFLAIPFIGRMDDIWASYYTEKAGFKVIYCESTVFQDRNEQNLTKNLKDEFIGYEKTKDLLFDLKKDINNLYKYIPEESKKVIEIYQDYFN